VLRLCRGKNWGAEIAYSASQTSKLRIEYIVRVSATLGKGRKTQKVSVELPFVMSDSKPPEIFVCNLFLALAFSFF
jgi:hypothetical protein